MEPKKILVAVDGSEQSLKAVIYAGKMLPPGQGTIEVFNVMDVIPESFWDLESKPEFHHQVIAARAWEQGRKKTMRDFMQKAVGSLRELGHAPEWVTDSISDRKVGIARDIIRRADQGCAALVVGRRGLSPLKDIVLGSIANKLITRMVGTPIWVVGGSPSADKVLVTLDGSDGALRALDYAGAVLGGGSARFLLLSVIRGFRVFERGYEKLFLSAGEQDLLLRAKTEFEEAEKQMERAFEEAIEKLEQFGIEAGRIETKVIKDVESRAGSIVEEARKGGWGTIVMGRRGLSRVQEFVMGRVSNKVLQLAREEAVWIVS